MENLIKKSAEELRSMQLDLDNLWERIKEIESRMDGSISRLDINNAEESITLFTLTASSNRLEEARRYIYHALDKVMDAAGECEEYIENE